MDIGYAFSYPFKDPDWFKKLAIIGLVGLIPILGWMVVTGFILQIVRRFMDNNPVLLPDLDFSAQLLAWGLNSQSFRLYIHFPL